jgi:hypothetical protein
MATNGDQNVYEVYSILNIIKYSVLFEQKHMSEWSWNI